MRPDMRRYVLLIVLCAWGCCRAATALDLGIVDSHRKVECGFAITNTSDKVWKVIGARSSCACMSVSVQQGEMKPGEVRPVAVTFDPAGMEGSVEKVVQIDLKPGKSVTQTYTANVRRRLGLDPEDAASPLRRANDDDEPCVYGVDGGDGDDVVYVSDGGKRGSNGRDACSPRCGVADRVDVDSCHAA